MGSRYAKEGAQKLRRSCTAASLEMRNTQQFAQQDNRPTLTAIAYMVCPLKMSSHRPLIQASPHFQAICICFTPSYTGGKYASRGAS
eukprot:scaffold14814_cov22-Tisochrysis_lutea.AAC.3